MKPTEEFVKFLGKGIYGSVNLINYTKTDGTSFHAAVKISDEYHSHSLQKELQILTKLKGCPRIIQCFSNNLEEDVDDKGTKFYKLLLEYASQGSLKAFMDNYNDRKKLPDTMIRDFTHMILEGLVTIHSHGFVHCDLKPDNILVFPLKDGSYELKICDFGLSVEDGEVPKHWKPDFPYVGTANYMSPESFHDGVAKKTLDLWSLGCLVLEMYLGKQPWKGVKTDDLVEIISDGNAPKIPKTVLPCDAREFIETCFARKPEDRGRASELLLNRFLRREEKRICRRSLRVTHRCVNL